MKSKVEIFKNNQIDNGFIISEGKGGDFATIKGNIKNWFSKVSEVDYKNNPYKEEILKEDIGINFIPISSILICPDKFYLKEGYLIIKKLVDIIKDKDYAVVFNNEKLYDLDNYYKEYILPYKDEMEEGFFD